MAAGQAVVLRLECNAGRACTGALLNLVFSPTPILLSGKRARLLHNLKVSSCQQRICCGAKVLAKTAVATPQAAGKTAVKLEKFVFSTAEGIRVLAAVEKQKKGFVVSIVVPSGQHPAESLALTWGTFRSSTAKWFSPEEVVPPGSSPVECGRGMRTQLAKSPSGQFEIQFKVPENLAPVFLGFQLELQGQDGKWKHHSPARGLQHFAVPVGLRRGDPLKYGASLATVAADGKAYSIDFAVVSRHATAMSLCIARRVADGTPGGYLEIALDPFVNRTGDVWHVGVEGLRDLTTLCYGWRADADISWDAGNRFHPGQVMLDPYAPIATKVQLPEGTNVPPPKKGLPSTGSQSNPPALLGCLSSVLEDFNWEDTARPGTPLEDTLVLELDVPSFTASDASAPSEHRGTYLGVLDRLELIRSLGATAVMLTPVTLGGDGLGPFGRAPFSFFAPEIAFASGSDPASAAQEMKQLVKGLHAANIEVYLQVEYCLTGEGWDEDASAISLRGLDAAVYYRSKGVLNCGHANVRALILDSLRHWARDYQVDGFCFVNAETLTLGRDGVVLDNPPLAEDIANDSDLRQLKLIAWSADDTLLPRSGQRGFPHWATWLERNKRFSDDFSAFFRGAGPPDVASNVATRICGSADLFEAAWESGLPGGLATGRRPAFGLNSASYLDKAPLTATVAAILPVHAPFGQDTVLKKSLLFASLMCQGTPVVGADVTQDASLVEFVSRLKRLRQQLAEMLVPMEFATERDLRWYGAQPGSQPDWKGDLAAGGVPAAAFLAYAVHREDGSGVYVAYNPYEGPVPTILPDPPRGSQWKRAVDTSDNRQSALLEQEWIPLSVPDYTVSARAALLLVAVPLPKPAQPVVKPGPATKPVAGSTAQRAAPKM